MGYGHGHKTNHQGRRAVYKSGAAAQTVFDNSMVAHIWAQQQQDFGRSGNGNYYFDEATIYSYGKHFPIAEFLDKHVDGKQLVLVTNAKSTVTTSHHVTLVRRALRGLPLHVIVVPDLRDWCDSVVVHRAVIESYAVAIGSTPSAQLMDWFVEATELEAYRQAFKVRERLPEDCAAWFQDREARRKAAAQAEDIQAARKFVDELPRQPLNAWEFPFSLDPLPPVADVDLYQVHNVRCLLGRISKRANVARYALSRAPESKARAARLAKLNLLRKQLRASTAAVETLQQLRQAYERLDRARDFAKAVASGGKNFQLQCYRDWNASGETWRFRDSQGLPRYPDDWQNILATLGEAGDDTTAVREWMARQASLAFAIYETGAFRVVVRHAPRPVRPNQREAWLRGEPVSFYQEQPTLVRRRGDQLETSRQAQAPWREAVAVFKIAQACRRTGSGMTYDGLPAAPTVGSFHVRSIDNDGNIRVGCHTIAFDEMLRLAVQEVPELVRPRYALPVCV